MDKDLTSQLEPNSVMKKKRGACHNSRRVVAVLKFIDEERISSGENDRFVIGNCIQL